MKKINYLLVFIFLLVISFAKVDAVTYRNYQTGNRISVKLNDSTTFEFYVIEDSNTNNSSVTALYVDILSEGVYDDISSEVERLSGIWTNATSVSLPTMQQIFGDDVDLSNIIYFSEPTWALNESDYWTSTSSEEGHGKWIIGDGLAGIVNNTDPANLRPVITISKDYVTMQVSDDGDNESGSNDNSTNDEDNEESPSTGDLDVLIFGGLIMVLAFVSFMAYKNIKKVSK